MSLREFVGIVRERWRLVAVLGLLGLAAGMGISAVSVPQYEAEAEVYVAAQPTGDSNAAYQGSLLAVAKAKDYEQLVPGANFTREVAAATGLDPALVPRQVVITAQDKSPVIVVSATDSSPNGAARLADAGAAALIHAVDDVERTSPGQTPPVTARAVEPATVPTSPESLSWPVYVALGLLVGLIAGSGLAVLRARLDSTVRTAASISPLLGAPSLGIVPQDTRAHRSVRIAGKPLSPTAEAYRKIRTGLEFAGLARDAGRIVVTSAVQGEGKTGVVGNLAVVIAEQGYRVVVVDADLRRPRLAAFFGASDDVGVTNVLSGQVPLEDAVQPGLAAGVAVLARGPEAPNPLDLIASAPMSALLDQLAESYDVVLVDSPSLTAVADASILASRCDGVILVVRGGRTTTRQLSEARAALSAASARVLGAVLVAVDRRAASPDGGPGVSRPWQSGRPQLGGSHRDTPSSARGGARRPTELRPLLPSPATQAPEDTAVNGDAILPQSGPRP